MKKFVLLIVIIFLLQMSLVGAHYQEISSVKKITIKNNISFIQNANYVIITTSNLEEAVMEFKTFKEYPGFSVEIINISWISGNYNGKDLQEKIRNFLIDKYVEWEIDYVLIVGTRNSIPMRRCDPIIWDFGEYLFSDF